MAEQEFFDESIDAVNGEVVINLNAGNDEVVFNDRLSPIIPLSNTSVDRQREREGRLRNRGNQNRSVQEVLKKAQRRLTTGKERRSAPLSASRSASSHRDHTERNRSPLAAGSSPSTSRLNSDSSPSRLNSDPSPSTLNTDAEIDEPSSDENEISVESQTTPRGRKKSSLVWNHCRQINKLTFCNYCASSFNLSDSTSTALYI